MDPGVLPKRLAGLRQQRLGNVEHRVVGTADGDARQVPVQEHPGCLQGLVGLFQPVAHQRRCLRVISMVDTVHYN